MIERPAGGGAGGLDGRQAPAPDSLAGLLVGLAADDRLPALLELQQDPVFAHVPAGERVAYAERSLAAGREQGERYRGKELFGLAAELGATVVIRQERHPAAGLVIRAEYDPSAARITVYRPSVEAVGSLLAQLLPGEWGVDRVIALHVAHELFHHLEATQIGEVHGQLPAVVTFRLGRVWERRARVRRCREVAAHAFAKQLLSLPVLPGALDWLLAVAEGKLTAEALAAEMGRVQKLLQGQAK